MKDFYKPQTYEQALKHIADLEAANERLEERVRVAELELGKIKSNHRIEIVERLDSKRLPK